MARDAGLEEAIRELLHDVDGLGEKRMFGGLAWLIDGRLLCAARTDGALVRLGKGLDGWTAGRLGAGGGRRGADGHARTADDRLGLGGAGGVRGRVFRRTADRGGAGFRAGIA